MEIVSLEMAKNQLKKHKNYNSMLMSIPYENTVNYIALKCRSLQGEKFF